MSTRRHVDDLFTGALDGDLSPIDEARFHAHLQSCSDCSAAFTEFTATVEALHELPKARMARVVHLPSTPPVAEESPRGRLSLGWLNPGMLLRRFPATAVAGAVAVVLVIIALTHGSGAPTTNGADQAGGANSATAPAPALDAACGQPTAITESSPPAQFAAPQVATNVSLPGVRLVLAASSLSVESGQNVSVFAQASYPVTTAQLPGATAVPAASRAVRPCVSVAVGSSGGIYGGSGYRASSGPTSETVPVAIPSTDHGGPVGQPAPVALPSESLVTFTVPAGLAPGTVLRVVASLPAGFDGPGSPALTATLTLTTH
jgi:hypothetical protein